MELKAKGAGSVRNGIEFQSHLYGIERFLLWCVADSVHVSIAPLWNWKDCWHACREKDRCFNRTFMELKVYAPKRNDHRRTFQSHLYGIESISLFMTMSVVAVSIAPLWNWKTGTPDGRKCAAGFNRTFMELKVGKKKLRLFSFKFQSHLYGIESEIGSTEIHMLSLFQSHLYGIESQITVRWRVLPNRFNRTFMELKVLCPCGVLPISPFQSHLYGIERRHDLLGTT